MMCLAVWMGGGGDSVEHIEIAPFTPWGAGDCCVTYCECFLSFNLLTS